MRVNPSLRLRRPVVYAAGAVPHALAMFGNCAGISSRRYIGGVLVRLDVIPSSLPALATVFMLGISHDKCWLGSYALPGTGLRSQISPTAAKNLRA